MRMLVGPARAWAGVVPPEPGTSLSWSGVPSPIAIAIGGSHNLAQYVEYDGEGSVTYSSIGASLAGTGISLNTSTGVLSVSGGASAGTVSGIQIRATDGTLSADSEVFSVTKETSALALDFPASFDLERGIQDNGDGGRGIAIDLDEYVTYSGGGSLTYTWIGGRPSNFISLNSSTANNGYPGRMRIAANCPPLSFPALTVQVTDGTHTETATFALNVSVPDYSYLYTQGLSVSQVASRNGQIDLAAHTIHNASGTLSYSSIGAPLPEGMSLNAATGRLSLSDVATGTYSGLQFRITDGTRTTDTPAFSLQVVDEDLIYPADLEWLGAFRLPADMYSGYSETYVGFNANGNGGAGSLFVPGLATGPTFGECTIPAPVASTSKAALNRATMIQQMIDPYEGTIGDISPPSQRSGQVVGYGDEAVMTAWQYYGDGQSKTHWIRPRNLATTGSLVGPVESEITAAAAFYPSKEWPHRSAAGAMCKIPAALQAALGGKMLTGHAGVPFNGNESKGPFACVFDPDDIGVETPLPLSGVLGYPDDVDLAYQYGLNTRARNIFWGEPSIATALILPEGRDTLLVIGTHGVGEYWYGEPATDAWANDLNWGYSAGASHSKGPSAAPGRWSVWAYRVSDLLAVKAGTKLHYEVRPYAVWRLDLPLYDAIECGVISGDYDPQTGRVYLACAYSDGDSPIVHVLEVQ